MPHLRSGSPVHVLCRRQPADCLCQGDAQHLQALWVSQLGREHLQRVSEEVEDQGQQLWKEYFP